MLWSKGDLIRCTRDNDIGVVLDFDPEDMSFTVFCTSTKLTIVTTEYMNGEDTISSVEYDGVEIDNEGGDTNGKGYYASVWQL